MGACPQVTATNASVALTGDLNFGATPLTYNVALTMTYGLTLNIPNSCLNGNPCANVGSTAPGVNVVCSGTSACACVMTATQTLAEAGTYVTSGSSVVTTSTDGTSETSVYCVQGKTLTFRPPNMTDDLVTAIVAQKP